MDSLAKIPIRPIAAVLSLRSADVSVVRSAKLVCLVSRSLWLCPLTSNKLVSLRSSALCGQTSNIPSVIFDRWEQVVV